jgi:YihY family inner membrane protein
MVSARDVEGGPASRARRAGQWLRRAFGIFLRIDGTQRAGAFAHFAFFSLFPAIILMVATASLVVDRERATSEVIAFIENYVPLGADKEGYVFRTIEGVTDARGHASAVAVILLCWGAMRFLATMVRATNRAWGPEVHNWWRLPLKSLALLLIIVILVPPGVLATVWLKELATFGSEQGGALELLRSLLAALLPLVLLFTGLTLFYRFAPRTRKRLAEVRAAALCSTALLAAAQLLFKFYLTHFATLNAVYGALGGVIALLMWIYLSGAIFIFGACRCAARADADPAPRGLARA